MTISSVFSKNFYSGALGALTLGAAPLAAVRVISSWGKGWKASFSSDLWYGFLNVTRNGVRLTKDEIIQQYPHLVAEGLQNASDQANMIEKIIQILSVVGIYSGAYIGWECCDSKYWECCDSKYNDDRRATWIGTGAGIVTALYCFSKNTPLVLALGLITAVGGLVSGSAAIALNHADRKR